MKLRLALAVAALALLPLWNDRSSHASLSTSDDGALHAAMEGLQAGMRQLGRRVADPEKHGEALGVLADMRRHVLVAFEVPPPAPAERDAAREAAEFRGEMLGVLGDLVALELAFLDRDVARARERFDSLNARKKAGHDRFRVGG
jgi:hypothetical protein